MPISRIGTDGIEAGAVAPSDLSTGAPSWDGSGNVTVSGRQLISTQPAFFAYQTAQNQTFSAGSDLALNNTRFNVGNCYNTSTGVFTAPVAGLYQFNWNVQHAAGAGAEGSFYIDLYLNGAFIRVRSEWDSIPANFSIITGSTCIKAAANDTVKIRIASGTVWTDGTSFSGFLMG